ncbi:MAG: hypothetical protein KBA61_03405 [Spirochaetes bacterium]|nr:hypothetical protein [Spirochaetota bacterium]
MSTEYYRSIIDDLKADLRGEVSPAEKISRIDHFLETHQIIPKVINFLVFHAAGFPTDPAKEEQVRREIEKAGIVNYYRDNREAIFPGGWVNAASPVIILDEAIKERDYQAGTGITDKLSRERDKKPAPLVARLKNWHREPEELRRDLEALKGNIIEYTNIDSVIKGTEKAVFIGDNTYLDALALFYVWQAAGKIKQVKQWAARIRDCFDRMEKGSCEGFDTGTLNNRNADYHLFDNGKCEPEILFEGKETGKKIHEIKKILSVEP